MQRNERCLKIRKRLPVRPREPPAPEKHSPKTQDKKAKATVRATIESSGQSPEQYSEQKIMETLRSVLPEMKRDFHFDLAIRRPFTIFDMYKPAKEHLDEMMREGRKWSVSVNTTGGKN